MLTSTPATQPLDDAAQAPRRDRAIRSAVIMSLVCKGGTALLQLVALPIAMRVLGWEKFGLYASVGAILMAVQLLEVGLGPALAHGLSKAAANRDRDRERRLYATSFWMMAVILAFGTLAMVAFIAFTPVSRMFGEKFVPYTDELLPALWSGLILFIGSVFLGHTDRVREGYLEVRTTYLWGAGANFIAALAVGAGVWFVPSVSYLLFAVYGSQLLGKLGNPVHLWHQRPWLRPTFRAWDGSLVRSFLLDGLAYAVFATVVNFVEFIVCQNFIGRAQGPVGVAGYSVLVTITTSLLGFVLMFTNPTWPAIVDAKARGDFPWIARTARRLWLYVLAFAGAAGFGVMLLGPWLLPRWFGDKATDLDRAMLTAFAVYFALYAWRHANHMLLVGMGRVKTLANIQLIESAMVLVAGWIGVQWKGTFGLLLAMSAAILAVTSWWLPLVFRRDLEASRRVPE